MTGWNAPFWALHVCRFPALAASDGRLSAIVADGSIAATSRSAHISARR
ncbi:MAG: hypothetical protein ACTHJR_00450 [Sphingomonas sp.]